MKAEIMNSSIGITNSNEITSEDILELSEEQGKENSFFNEGDEKFFIPVVNDIPKLGGIVLGDKENVKMIIPEYAKDYTKTTDKITNIVKELKSVEESILENKDNDANIINETKRANRQMVDLSKKICDTFCNMYEGVIIDKKLTLRKGVAHEFKHRKSVIIQNLFNMMIEHKAEIKRKLNKDNAQLFEYLASLLEQFNLNYPEKRWYNHYDDIVAEIINTKIELTPTTITLKEPFYFYKSEEDYRNNTTMRYGNIKKIVITGRKIQYYNIEDGEIKSDVPKHIQKLLFDSVKEIKDATSVTKHILDNLNNKLEIHNTHIDKFCSKHLVLAGLLTEGTGMARYGGGFDPNKDRNRVNDDD